MKPLTKQVYYAAIVLNTLLRFSWVLHFVPHVNLRLEGFIIGLIETSRRWLWNVRVHQLECHESRLT